MGWVGSCFDNATAEVFSSSLKWGVLSRHAFETTGQAQAVVLDWCYEFYNRERRHRSVGMMSPVNYENTAAPTKKPHRQTPPRFGVTTGLRHFTDRVVVSQRPLTRLLLELFTEPSMLTQ